MAAISIPDYRLLFDSVPGLYLVLTPDLTIAAASDAYLRATMTRREEIVGHNLYEIFPDNPDSSEHALGSDNLSASLQRVLRNLEPDVLPVQRYDVRRPAAEGGDFVTRYWSPCNLPILDGSGKLLWILHCVEDVTNFVRFVSDENASNGADADTLNHQRRMEQTNLTMARLARALEQHVAERTSELANANRQLDDELAKRQRLEQQFRQAQKMEAIGRLAGGVAHDFNNLLTVIQGYGDSLTRLETDPGKKHKLEQILRASQRAAGLTRQLLAFSRQQILQPRVLDLNDIVTETSSMLRRMIGEDIELATVLPAGLGHINADAGQIEQILMNLAVNARDAMPDGGRLTIETANVELDTMVSRHGGTVAPGPYVMLAVTDTGIGMDAATLERIFEPFFTTKPLHKGTGLGLATVYGVVKQSGGSIWVYSEPGLGACFKIYLPRVEASAVPYTRPAEFAVPLEGGETILLVEDEDEVRELVRSTLAEHGYRVLAANGPKEALALFERAVSPVDLLLSDLIMAGMNGRELSEELQRRQPGLKRIYMSGYTDDTVVRQGVIGEGMPFLQKPFRQLDLLVKLRSVLDAEK